MPDLFRMLATPPFERDVRKRLKRNPKLLIQVEEVLAILRKDPYNTTGHFNIKKLTAVAPGEGQWRIRLGDYRVRYDIFANDVVLYSFRHRKESY
ncbi:MAG TPA: type II toxin-antitoxin system RelE/ParE family toxin [Blastocatellia bacterium]|nr:type II toxin-antitoxin system RelE/ParE family toxin [Blastocatellia bacterium]